MAYFMENVMDITVGNSGTGKFVSNRSMWLASGRKMRGKKALRLRYAKGECEERE